MCFHISLDDESARFLPSGDLKTWTVAEDQGFLDDGPDYAVQETKMNRVAKAALLKIILGSVATYSPVISPKFVKSQATSLEAVFNRLRSYYGFRKSGTRILELMEFSQQQDESREALWERLYTYMEDNLLSKNGGIKHEGIKVETDETFSPTLLNVLVACWLHILDPGLPALVRSRFSTQLRDQTVYTIREEISDAIPSLLQEKEERDGAVCRSGPYQKGRFSKQRSYNNSTPSRQGYRSNKPKCCLCEAAGRPQNNHFLSACPYLPAEDKRFISRGREIAVESDDVDSEEEETSGAVKMVSKNLTTVKSVKAVSRKVEIISSLILSVKVNNKPSDWTLDGGATSSMIEEEECERLGVEILPTCQRATQADGLTPLPVLGEVHFIASKGHHTFKFSGLVVRSLDAPVLAGMPFLKLNKITVDYGQDSVTVDNCCKFQPNHIKSTNRSAVLRVSSQQCILPGEEATFYLPDHMPKGDPVAIEPRTTIPQEMPRWFDCSIVVPDEDGRVSVRNVSSEPVLLGKHTQVCQARPTAEITRGCKTQLPGPDEKCVPTTISSNPKVNTTNTIQVDPSNKLTKVEQSNFHRLHSEFQEVFTGGIGCYNNYN